MKNCQKLITACALVTLSVTVSAQSYLADLSTTLLPTGGGVADRLYLDAAFTTEAPVGARLWVVADTDGNGLPSYAGAISPDLVLGSGDQIIFYDAVDGTILGNQTGRYNRAGITSLNENANYNLYAFLWGRGVPTSEADVAVGDTFGVFNIGIRPPPGVGNASWYIYENINGSQFSITPVPEPTTGAIAGLGLIGLALLRRRFSARA
jgi:hypothetical protein